MLLVGVSGVLNSGYFLSELNGADATILILQLLQSGLVAILGGVFLVTAASHVGPGAPRLKPAVMVLSLAILATAAADLHLNSETKMTEGIMVSLASIGGLAAGALSFGPSPNQRTGPMVGAASALMLFITFLVRDDARGVADFFAPGIAAPAFLPGLVGHGAEAVFKLLAILVASVTAVAWPRMQHGSSRALVVRVWVAAAVMLAIGLLIGAINGFRDKPLDSLSGAPGLIGTAQVLFFISLITELAAAVLVGGAAFGGRWPGRQVFVAVPPFRDDDD